MEIQLHAQPGLSLFSLRGRTAVVSGVATTGIGFAIAEILAEAGANVALLYNTNDSAKKAARIISERYHVQSVSNSKQSVSNRHLTI